MGEERWRRVEGWPYSVSDQGRVRNDRTGKVLSPATNHSGYQRVSLCKSGERKNVFVHRLVLTAFYRPPRENEQTNHINADKADNRLDNLEWVTFEDNVGHALEAGLYDEHAESARGQKAPASKLTPPDILEIRRRYEGEETQYELADAFGVDQRTISRIVRGEQWGHIKEQGDSCEPDQ